MNAPKDQPRTKAELLREIAELRQALERFEVAVQGSNEGLWDWDITNNYVFFSVRWKGMLGYEDDEITNDFAEFESRLHPDDHDRVMATVADYLAGQIPTYEVEFRCRHKEGSYRWILARGHALRNTNGHPYRMAGSHTDITAQKQAEDALQASESRNRNLLQAIPDMIIRYRADGTYLDIKPSKDFRAFRSAHELIGKNLFEVAPPEVARQRMHHIQLALQTRQAQNYEHTFIRDGETKFEEIWVVPTEVTDEVSVVIRDVTERRRVEEALVKRAAELQTVARVGTAASTILEIDKLLQEVVDLTKSSFDLYHAHVYLFNQERDRLVLAAGAGQVGQQMLKKGWSIPLEREHSLVARAARSRQGVVVNDVRQEPDFLPNPLLPHTRAEMAIPLIVGNQVLGVLDVQADTVGRFTEEDLRIKTILAGQVAVALQNARSFAEEQHAQHKLSKRIDELDCLNDLGREIAETPPVPKLLQWVAERIPPAMQYPALCQTAIEYDSQIYGQPTAIEQPCQIVNALRIGGKVIGRIYIAYTEKRGFLDEESALIGGIASRLSGYIESRILLDQTREAQAESALLYATANRLIEAADPNELLEAASAYVRSLGANSGQLLYLESNSQGRPEWAETIAQWQATSMGMPLGTRFYLPDFAMAKLWISQPDQPLLVAETMTSELVDPVVRKLLVQTQVHALALLPLTIKGRLIGLISFSWNTPYSFTERDQRILTTIAQQTATVVDAVQTSQQIQAALAENQQQKEFLGKVINILPVGLFAKDIKNEYRFSIWNAKMEEMFGAKAEEMLGKNDYDFFSDKEEADYYRQTDTSVMEAAQIVDIPVEEVTTRYGVILAHTTKLPIYGSDGQPEVLLGLLENITERKRAEETLRQSEARLSEALSIARLANWEFDVATQTFTFNDQFYSLFRTTAEREGGYTMPAMQYAQKFVHPEDAPLVGIEIQKALEATDPNYSTQLEHRIIRADESAGYILVRFRVIKDEQGRTVKTIGANQDITERKLAELERERLLAEIEAAYRQYVRGEWEQLLREQQGNWRIEHQARHVEQAEDRLTQLQEKVLHEGKTTVMNAEKNNGHETEPIMVAPISLRGQVIGTLSLQGIAPDRVWTEEELTLVEAVSEQLALTLENLRLYEETQRAAWRDRVVSESTAKVWSSAEIEEVMRAAVAQLGDKLRASEVVIRLGTEEELLQR